MGFVQVILCFSSLGKIGLSISKYSVWSSVIYMKRSHEDQFENLRPLFITLDTDISSRKKQYLVTI